MISLFYPFIGGLIFCCIVIIIYKLLTKKTKYSIFVGFGAMILYFIFMTPNAIKTYSGVIEDKGGRKCSISMNNLYDDFNPLNRYNPLFNLSNQIINPDKCENVEYCYWRSATYNQFESCIYNKSYLNNEQNKHIDNKKLVK